MLNILDFLKKKKKINSQTSYTSDTSFWVAFAKCTCLGGDGLFFRDEDSIAHDLAKMEIVFYPELQFTWVWFLPKHGYNAPKS